MPGKDVRKSAVKTFAQSERARLRHKATRNALWTTEKKLRAAVEAGDKNAASDMLKSQYAALDKAVKAGAMHKNQANSTKSRLGKLVAQTAVVEFKPD